MTNGFLAFPLCVPGTAVWKGRKGRLFILEVLTKGAAESKAKMKVCELGPCCCSKHGAWACGKAAQSAPCQFGAPGLQLQSNIGILCQQADVPHVGVQCSSCQWAGGLEETECSLPWPTRCCTVCKSF